MEPSHAVALLIILLAAVGVARGFDVRVVLLAAAFAIAGLVGQWQVPLIECFVTFADAKFIVPICTAMGFAYVLKHTGCDQHLVRLLTAPLRHARPFLLPGVCAVGFIVNIPVISQTACAVCLGPVVVPLLRAAGYGPGVIAACLCLGASVGGELLNPAAPELVAVTKLTATASVTLSRNYIPGLLLPYVTVAVAVFWIQSVFEERRKRNTGEVAPQPAPADTGPISLLKAAIPLIPLLLLFASGPPFNFVSVPKWWLVSEDDKKLFDGRLIGVAMVIGTLCAAAASPGKAKQVAKQFFDGAGYGFANVVSLIVTASAFGKAVEAVGLAALLGRVIARGPEWLVPLAASVPCGFAAVSGSGMASTQSLFGFFHGPAVLHGYDADAVGAVVSIGSAAGRTMSPAAAVVLMCASLTGVNPLAVVKRVVGPLLLGLIVSVLLRVVGVV